MVAVTFDTLAYSKKPREVGVPEQVAEVQAEALAGIIDNKKDLLVLEERLVHGMEGLENRIEKLGYKLTIRLGGMIVIGVLVLAAIAKF